MIQPGRVQSKAAARVPADGAEGPARDRSDFRCAPRCPGLGPSGVTAWESRACGEAAGADDWEGEA